MTAPTGVTVRVGAAHSGGLATRSCEAFLGWDRQQLSVATGIAQLDVDVLGTDLGWDMPVVAFQLRKQAEDCCAAYQIYSLRKPPRLLRTITGGSSFRAADTDLDGQVEIWTDDALAATKFEGFDLSELDTPPTVVLRFDHGRLVDVSAEFQAEFDKTIARLRTELDPASLRDFKASDGVLTASAGASPKQLHRLRQAKLKCIEIVWAYLYSGREEEAWRALEDLWPASDLNRIREAFRVVRSRGLCAQVDGVSLKRQPHKKRVRIFDATQLSAQKQMDLIPPQALLLWRPPGLAALPQQASNTDRLLVLVIDAAGKVHSAEPAAAKWSDPELLDAAREWKFVPAFTGGKAVACRFRLSVSPTR